MKNQTITATSAAITATCAVVALSIWIFNSFANEKNAKASDLLDSCKRNYAWSAMVSYTGGLICEAFVGKYLDGTISYEKAVDIVSDESKYFEYIGKLPEVKEIGRQVDKVYKEAGVGAN